MFTVGLEPGNVYTAWWVLANNPEFCEADPCSGGDFIGKAVEGETVVTYAELTGTSATVTSTGTSDAHDITVVDNWFAAMAKDGVALRVV